MNNGIFGFPKKKIPVQFFDTFLLNTNDAVRVDEFTVAGTYNKIQIPANANYLTILAYGGGAGGGGGGAQFPGTTPTGMGGGGGGGTALVRFDLRNFPQHKQLNYAKGNFYITVVVGAGGAGGAGSRIQAGGASSASGGNTTVNLTNSAGTSIMRLAVAGGGSGVFGGAGQRTGVGGFHQNGGMFTGPSNSTALSGNYPRGQDGSGNAGWNSGGFRFPKQWSASNPNDIPLHPYICGGGGAGGVVNTDAVSQQAGGAGGLGYFFYEPFRAADGGTGAGADATLEDIVFAGVGGNGGYSATPTQAINAFNGGAGIRGGGGGGGGGIVMNTFSLTATLSTGTGYVILTGGTTGTLSIGNTFTKLGGAGSFAAGATILSIDGATALTMSQNHSVAGSITFQRLGTYSSGSGGVGGAGYCLLIWDE